MQFVMQQLISYAEEPMLALEDWSTKKSDFSSSFYTNAEMTS